jgi:hypothetical protein
MVRSTGPNRRLEANRGKVAQFLRRLVADRKHNGVRAMLERGEVAPGGGAGREAARNRRHDHGAEPFDRRTMSAARTASIGSRTVRGPDGGDRRRRLRRQRLIEPDKLPDGLVSQLIAAAAANSISRRTSAATVYLASPFGKLGDSPICDPERRARGTSVVVVRKVSPLCVIPDANREAREIADVVLDILNQLRFLALRSVSKSGAGHPQLLQSTKRQHELDLLTQTRPSRR